MARFSKSFQPLQSNREFSATSASPNRHFTENSHWVPLSHWLNYEDLMFVCVRASLMTYIMLRKNLTPLYVRKKFLTRGLGKKFLPKLNHPYPPPSQKSNGLACVIMSWFSRLTFCTSRLKIRR